MYKYGVRETELDRVHGEYPCGNNTVGEQQQPPSVCQLSHTQELQTQATNFHVVGNQISLEAGRAVRLLWSELRVEELVLRGILAVRQCGTLPIFPNEHRSFEHLLIFVRHWVFRVVRHRVFRGTRTQLLLLSGKSAKRKSGSRSQLLLFFEQNSGTYKGGTNSIAFAFWNEAPGVIETIWVYIWTPSLK